MKQQLKRRIAVALLLTSGVLFAGCVAVENSYVVNEDGSGTQTVRLTLPAEVATSFGEEMPDIEEMEDDPEPPLQLLLHVNLVCAGGVRGMSGAVTQDTGREDNNGGC